MISVLLPTRGRPDNVDRLLMSALVTAETDVEFVFYVDVDDNSSVNVIKKHGGKIVTGERIVLSEMWNRCWEHASHDVVMQCGDDIVFRTTGWDTLVLNEFDRYDDKIVFVHGDDGFQHERVGTHGFLHRNWIETIGYFLPPYFSSDYNDLWLTEVADALGRRRYLPNVVTEHMHPVVGKGEWDQTHQERLQRHRRDNVDQLYRSLKHERLVDVQKLQKAIDDYVK